LFTTVFAAEILEQTSPKKENGKEQPFENVSPIKKWVMFHCQLLVL